MASRTQMLLNGGFSQDNKRKVKARSVSVVRGDGFSGERVLDEEPLRIESYIKQDYLDNIISKETAREAINSLRHDSTKTPLGDEDFRNLLRGAGGDAKDRFADYLFEKYAPDFEKIRESEVTLRSGAERSGLRINQDIYLIVTKTNQLVARSFKDGRFVKFTGNTIKRAKFGM